MIAYGESQGEERFPGQPHKVGPEKSMHEALQISGWRFRSGNDCAQLSMAPPQAQPEYSYQKIVDDLLRQMDSGLLNPGDTVDSERRLAKRYGVSLMTARRALSELASNGVVLRRPGARTVVAPPQIQPNRLLSFSEQMTERRLPLRSKVIRVARVHDDEIAARLSLAPGRSLTQIERLRLTDSIALALETAYLAADIRETWAHVALEQGSIFGLMERSQKLSFSHSDEEIDAVEADTHAAELLELEVGLPLLRIRQVVYSKHAAGCLYVHGLYRADRHKVLLRRFR